MRKKMKKRYKSISSAIALIACCLSDVSPASSPVLGYLGKGREPSMAEKYPKAPPLPADRSVLEAFAVSNVEDVAPAH
jgi:hypothetical protein